MITIDVWALAETIGIWLLAVAVTVGLAGVTAKTQRWSGLLIGVLLALATVGVATLLQMVL